jgi:hypothetical protein
VVWKRENKKEREGSGKKDKRGEGEINIAMR